MIDERIYKKFRHVNANVRAARWNWDESNSRPVETMGRDAENFGIIRGTNYEEVSMICGGTSGVTTDGWVWSACGVLQTNRGITLLRPGDWVVYQIAGDPYVMSDEEMSDAFSAPEVHPVSVTATHIPRTSNDEAM